MPGGGAGRVEAGEATFGNPAAGTVTNGVDAGGVEGLGGIPKAVARRLEWVLAFPSGRRCGYEPLQRLSDLLVIGATLPLWLTLIGICCLIMKIESPRDPAVYRSWRTGRHGQRFRMYKIRTMIRNADRLLPDLMHLSQQPWPEIKIRDDPRVTRFGHILRRTHLDELPQLFNVIRGDMCLVGPRPTSASVDCYEAWHRDRLRVKPGITGLWQILQHDVNHFDIRVRLDILYIDRCCWRLDMLILLRTIGRVLAAGRSAA